MCIVDIIWLPHIVDKVAWKHGVTPEEVDEVLFGKPYYRKVRRVIFLGKMFILRWGVQKWADI